MSQQSNPATLRELWSAVSDVWAYCPVCDQANGKHCQHLEGCVLGAFEVALAASGTHSLPPQGGQQHGDRITSAEAQELRFLQDVLDHIEDGDLWTAKTLLSCQIETLSQPTDAVAMNESASQGLQKASPEGEGREQAIADMRDYCLSTHEGWPIAKRYESLRQSAAPSGGAAQAIVALRALHEKIGGTMSHTPPIRYQIRTEIQRIIDLFAQESKTGAVTDAR